MKKLVVLGFVCFMIVFVSTSCDKDSQTNHTLSFSFEFDPTMPRLDNLGNPSSIPAGNSAQSPSFNKMSAHYIELAQDMYTALGTGAVIYRAPEVTTGGAAAIDFSKSVFAANNETFFTIDLKQIPAGTYKYLRLSLAYQNYDITFKYKDFLDTNIVRTGTGTIASFVGFNTYITNYLIKSATMTVNANKLQGYWGFETMGYTLSGQAPANSTTVPNPLFATSPVPSGSCVVTAAFEPPLVITGDATKDMKVRCKISTNKSFEWKDVNMDGFFQPDAGDAVVDMGVRGLRPIVE